MARPQYRIHRKIATVPLVENGFATIDIPRDYDYETISVRIVGNVNVTVAGTAVRADAPCQLIPRMELVADGKNNLFSAPFWFASLANYARPLTHQGARVVTPPSGFAIANYAIEAIGMIDLASVDCVRPKDSNFRSAPLSLFQLRLSFGACKDLFTGNPTAAPSNLNIEVYAQQLVELPDVAGSIAAPGFVKKISYQEIALNASNANQEIRLPANNLIKSVVMRTDGLTTAGEPSTGVLNNVQLAAGVDVRLNLSGAQLRAKNNADFGLFPAGYYVADLTRNGSAPGFLSELWDVGRVNEPKLIVDVTGGANVKMQSVTTEYLPA